MRRSVSLRPYRSEELILTLFRFSGGEGEGAKVPDNEG